MLCNPGIRARKPCTTTIEVTDRNLSSLPKTSEKIDAYKRLREALLLSVALAFARDNDFARLRDRQTTLEMPEDYQHGLGR